jgi:hypothetical protein
MYLITRGALYLFKSQLTFLNAELNPICNLLALLAAHRILHVSRIRVNIQVQILTDHTDVYITSLNRYYSHCLLIFGATAPSGQGPPHSRGF